MIARALAQEARLLVMDEPTSHLDFRNELIVLDRIAELVKANGISVLMATHAPNHGFYLENKSVPVRVALMRDRSILCTGLPEEVLSAERLRDLYGINARVISHCVKENVQHKYIIPLSMADE